MTETLDRYLAISKLLTSMGVIEIRADRLELTNDAWINAADTATRFETDEYRLDDEITYSFWKKRIRVFTRVERSFLPKFALLVQARPSLCEKIKHHFGFRYDYP